MALGLFAQIGLLAHLFSLLVPALGAQFAGFAAGQILGSLAFLFAAGDNVPLLLLGVVLFGAGIGNTTSLPPLIAQAEFVKQEVPRVVSLIVAIGQAAYAFAPATFGFIRELTPRWGSTSAGAAPWMFIAAALIQASALVVFLVGRRHKKR